MKSTSRTGRVREALAAATAADSCEREAHPHPRNPHSLRKKKHMLHFMHNSSAR